jgi:UDP-N-acetyl-D-mannosaminuronate dehydrogenase
VIRYDPSVIASQAPLPSRIHRLQRVAVIGQGYAGLTLAMTAVEAGHGVVRIDVDKARAGRLLLGESYVDDVADTRLRAAIISGRFAASEDYARAAGFDGECSSSPCAPMLTPSP